MRSLPPGIRAPPSDRYKLTVIGIQRVCPYHQNARRNIRMDSCRTHGVDHRQFLVEEEGPVTDHQMSARHPLEGLLVGGPRLGWTYQDPTVAMVPFGEQRPVAGPPAAAEPLKPFPLKRILVAVGIGLGVTTLAGCCGLVAQGPNGIGDLGTQIVLFAVALTVGTVGLVVFLVWKHNEANARLREAASMPQRQYEAALAGWQQRATAHAQTEAARVAAMDLWQSTGPQPGVTRLDIVGGTADGWRDLILVAGSGYLAAHGPSVVIDLTGDRLASDLYEMCHATGVPCDWQTPPGDSDLLAGLGANQLVDVLVESVHGDGDRELRDRRATDTRILTAVVAALGPDQSLGRIGDALRVLLKIPGPTPHLSASERTRIADELFPADYLSASLAILQRLEAHLHPLQHLTSRPPRPPATLTIMAASNDGTSARSELIDDLILAWVTRRIADAPETCRTLMLAAADTLPARQIERLADICHRQTVTLIVLWRHLRATAATALGSGAVAFMRMRNVDEATRAADFIGRTHKFVLSGLTRTVGGSTSRTGSTGTSDAISRGASSSFTRGGRIAELINRAQSWTRAQGTTTGTTHTVSNQTSFTSGENWGEASSTQRVYEYAIEPSVLQGLPEHAVLLVEHGQHGPVVNALDCNPAIVCLPRVNMSPAARPAAPPIVPQPYSNPAIAHTPPPQSALDVNPPPQIPQQHRRTELWSDREL